MKRSSPVAAMLAVGALLWAASCGHYLPAQAEPSVSPAWGVLASDCAPDRVASERAAGVSVAVVSAQWDHLEPAPGRFDPTATAALAAAISTCTQGGLRVVVDSGVQYPPVWARSLPAAALVDQDSHTPVGRGPLNTVFSAPVRAVVATYLSALAGVLDAGGVPAVRIGTTASGELGYPGPTPGTTSSWWAFDAAAQTGAGLPAGQAANPLPGWRPGEPSWAGRPVSPAEASSWLSWYDMALVSDVVWQAGVLRAAGFPGAINIPVAGRGLLPADSAVATSSLLDGSGNRDGSLGRGLDYPKQFPALAAAHLSVDLTSLDDVSAVRARRLDPPQDTCRDDDAAGLDRGSQVERWSNLRWARAVAARAGLDVSAENPGPPGPQTGGEPDSDSEAQQLGQVRRYAADCRVSIFLLAFDDALYTSDSGITPADYARVIAGG